jgi:hypothetical protein
MLITFDCMVGRIAETQDESAKASSEAKYQSTELQGLRVFRIGSDRWHIEVDSIQIRQPGIMLLFQLEGTSNHLMIGKM